MSLVASDELWVRAYLPESERLELGQKLRVTVDSIDGDLEGEVTYISSQAEFVPGNVQTPEERSKQVFRIKVSLHDDRGRLRAGMAADVWLPDRES
jgi:multidrug resistance efflux pump